MKKIRTSSGEVIIILIKFNAFFVVLGFARTGSTWMQDLSTAGFATDIGKVKPNIVLTVLDLLRS